MDEFTADHSVCRRLRNAGATQCWALARQFVLGLLLALACQTALAQAMYRLKPVGSQGGCSPVAFGLNEVDQVTGDLCLADSSLHAFLWNNDGTPIVDLGPPEVGSVSQAVGLNASGVVVGFGSDSAGPFAFVASDNGTPMKLLRDGLGGSLIGAFAINDSGQITGDASTSADDSVLHAFVWKNNGSPILDLGTLGGDNSAGRAINASGQVTGFAFLPGNTKSHAFVWKNDGTPMHDLGTLGSDSSYGSFINASGQVAGFSTVPETALYPRNHAFFWRNDGTPMQDLGTLGGSYSSPKALNDLGQIAGDSYKHGQKTTHAFVWLNDGTPMKDLGTLGGLLSSASDINSSGQVTGYAFIAGNTVSHAFLWKNDGTKIQDLNKLIDPTDPLRPYVTLTFGNFINNHGDIAAEGTDSRTGLSGTYLLQGTVLTLSPRSLAFGSHPINTTSAAKSVVVTNTSAKVVAITSIALKGSAAGQFASTNNCGSSLVGHAICTIKVTFKPTTKGAKSATLDVNGGGGGLRSVTVTGTGT